MSKYWILSFLTTICLILGSLIVITFTVRNRIDIETYQQRYEKLGSGMEYSYTPKHNNLNIIVLHLKNPGIENNGVYKFSIMDSAGYTPVSQTFTGFNIGDPSDLRFQFEPIANSGNKNLTLRLDSQSSDNNTISVGVDEKGGIAFSSYYRSENLFGRFIDVVRNLIIHIGEDAIFFGFLFTTLFLVFWKWKNIR